MGIRFLSFFLSWTIFFIYLFIHSFHFTIKEYESLHIGNTSCSAKENAKIIINFEWEHGGMESKRNKEGKRKKETSRK